MKVSRVFVPVKAVVVSWLARHGRQQRQRLDGEAIGPAHRRAGICEWRRNNAAQNMHERDRKDLKLEPSGQADTDISSGHFESIQHDSSACETLPAKGNGPWWTRI